MTKRPVLFWACAFICGILFGLFSDMLPVLFGGLLLPAGMIPLVIHKKRLTALLWGVIFLGCALAGFLFGHGASRSYENLSAMGEGRQVLLAGEVTRVAEKENSLQIFVKKLSLVCDGEEFSADKLVLTLDSSEEYEIVAGDIIYAKGSIYYFDEAVNFGNFDLKKYYRSLNIPFGVKVSSIGITKKAKGITALLSRLSASLRRVYEKELEASRAGTLCAMILGDKSTLDSEVKSLYQSAGISHVLAVSGLHVSLLCMSLYRFLRKRRMSLPASAALSSCAAICFLAMTGYGISTQRAVGCFALVLLARAWGRNSDTLSSLGLMAVVILSQNPFALTNTGFLMSFGAMVGIALFTDDFWSLKDGEPPEGLIQKAGTKIKDQLKCSLGIFLVTAPMTAYSGSTIPVYSFFLNLFVIPLMTPLLMSGLLGGILGLIPGEKEILMRLVFLPAELILAFFDRICSFSLKLPFSSLIVGQPGKIKLLVYYGALMLLYLIRLKIKEIRKEKEPGAEKKLRKRDRVGKTLLINVLPIGLLLLFLFAHPDPCFHIDILDVGQGDGSLIHTKGGTVIFTDGGSTDQTSVGTYRILPFLKAKGYSHVDYWIITHGDQDHYSGISEILESGYKIDHLVVSQISNEDENLSELLELAREKGTEIDVVSKGCRIEEQEGEESLVLDFIWPIEGQTFEDKNDGCLSYLLTYRKGDLSFRGLFCGDIPAETEEALLEDPYAGPLLADGVDLYKCDHHGSRYSSSTSFLSVLSPKITTISAGEDNSYGHPAEETLEKLSELGSKLYLTMECGQITIENRGGDFYLFTFLGKDP